MDDDIEVKDYQGADVDAENNNKNTPLLRSSSCGRVDIVKLLLTEGADTKHENLYGWT